MGIWHGKFMNQELEAFISSCDCILGFGPERHYFNMSDSSRWTFDTSKTINVHLHSVRVGMSTYDNVEMTDVLAALDPAPAQAGPRHRCSVKGHSIHRDEQEADPIPSTRGIRSMRAWRIS